MCNPRKNALLKDGNKNDHIDARKLAELLRGNQLKPVYHGETGVRMLRVALCGAPAVEPKPSPRRRRGLDASTVRGLTESSGEVFSLDILSHRMSVNRLVSPTVKLRGY